MNMRRERYKTLTVTLFFNQAAVAAGGGLPSPSKRGQMAATKNARLPVTAKPLSQKEERAKWLS
jgi:hypothetical protein